jgi:GntR family transcriptional regulator, arabinose operon transcriptional repressor
MVAKHTRVFEELLRDIQSGQYRVGQKFPAESALVKRFGASRITVGRALNDLEQAGWVSRFAGSGTYVSSPARQPLLFGLIIPDLGSTEIFERICQGIASAPDAGGHALLWPQGSGDALELCRQCIERNVAGVFFAPVERDSLGVNRKVMTGLKAAGIPVVLLDRRSDASDRCDLVCLDNQRAGFLAAGHLLKLGARRIGFLALKGQASSVVGRIAGYREVVADPHVFEVGETLELPAAAYDFDAFVCSNDRIAGHLMFHLLAAGRRIPGDVRIVGIDDVRYASLLPVPLTTIHQPCREIGEAALRMMLQRLTHPKMPSQELLLDCELVIRESCGARSEPRTPEAPVRCSSSS